MDNEKMAKFIYELRTSVGLTQKELAQRLGITDKAVSKWERGHSALPGYNPACSSGGDSWCNDR